jgi:hypothetical protein
LFDQKIFKFKENHMRSSLCTTVLLVALALSACTVVERDRSAQQQPATVIMPQQPAATVMVR